VRPCLAGCRDCHEAQLKSQSTGLRLNFRAVPQSNHFFQNLVPESNNFD
jgi:hypothetical protein